MPLTILLNMIVKNESKIIVSTLTNLCNKINFSYWVISDTGSTDNTKELITDFFNKKNIPGELHEDAWKDFGYNRTKALEYAYNKSDLLLTFDADDTLEGDIQLPQQLDNDLYHLKFTHGTNFFWRVCLINNRKKCKYLGVLHEYLTCTELNHKVGFLFGNYNVVCRTVGEGRNSDPEKYIKDAIVLENAYKELNENDDLRNRYAFYCANSYRDAGNFDKAIEWYYITIGLKGGWPQEKYYSCMMLNHLCINKKEYEKGLFFCLQSYKYDKTRVECILKLVQHYCANDMNDVAMNFYILIQDWYEETYARGDDQLIDKLFVNLLDYNFNLPYYMIIVSEKVKKHTIGVKMYDLIFSKKILASQWFIDNLFFNIRFFVKLMNKKIIQKAKDYIIFLEANNITVKDEHKQMIN